MSSLLRVSVRSIHTTSAVARGPLSFDGWYPRDHKPGPHPENEAERRASAIKYGLRPEDYKPIDKDDVRLYAGDYPDAGPVNYDVRDPYENYSDRYYRRNWGELVPMDLMRTRPDRFTTTGLDAEDFTHVRALVLILRVVIPMLLVSYFYSDPNPNGFRWKNPVLPKQYSLDYYRAFPFEDPRKYPIVNYSFEPLD
uniref:NADH dehydrogenase [ubiquinone] 1 beta subcomplex subunit 8, mitochondrial n=1 Tax=Panagrellus redivivus TaxID=6233 RepID=A0A7E4W5D9_PANRE